MGVLIAVTVLAAAGVALVLALVLSMAPVPRAPTAAERRYTHGRTGKKGKFTSILETEGSDNGANPNEERVETKGMESGPVSLSVVVPAFNETPRLAAMLNEAIDCLEPRVSNAFTYEIILVDDGSKDGTSAEAERIAKDRKCDQVRILTLEKNRGKGGAVTQGILVARGCRILFADADGATKFGDIEKLERKLDSIEKNGLGVAIGSRAHMVKSDAVVKRSFIRNFLMHGFHTVLLVLGISSIKDTQCGFKMLTRKSAVSIFPNMHVEGWIFDIEMLLLATWHKIPIVEVPVTWNEIDGSKVSILRDSIRMAIDLLIIRIYYFTGLWSAFPDKRAKKAKAE
ncbi:dolichyl-phosphate beta-glucosyltransferase [Chytriomyces hyalinus]|nr:dolichyl-phosphate beta-glucosyltransferase [Chytriomyces hyalinus]